jgi:hypothetical protein
MYALYSIRWQRKFLRLAAPSKVGAHVVRFENDQSPPHENKFPFASVPIQSDNRLEGLRRDVPWRTQVEHHRAMNCKVFSDLLLIAQRSLERWNIIAQHPQDFLIDQFHLDPSLVLAKLQ